MSRVIFSSWAGKVIDNRGLRPSEYASIDIELPLKYNGHRVRAFMSWNGLVVADDKVDIVDMAHRYLKEVQKLSCGQCSVGYLGLKVMLGLFTGIAKGKGNEGDIELLLWLGAGVKENAKCDFCPQALTPLLDTLNYYKEAFIKPAARGKKAKSTYMTRVTAPCLEACPAHQDIPGYIELIKNRRYKEALELILETNCLPQTTGRACVAFCEANCVRNEIDSPLAIRALKRFAEEYGRDTEPVSKRVKVGKPKVAIIGAGVAGLAAGYNLALAGYRVTIFDELSAAGGMALVGIPPYRLPKDILAAEIDIVGQLGVEIKLNTKLGRDITLGQLSRKGFKAIFIATGAHLGRESDILNWKDSYTGLVDGVKLLSDVNLGKKVKARDRVIIVGGGNVAIDCARTCLRLGFKEVTIVYRRSRVEMPGRKDEVEAAEEEGVKIHFLAVPVKVLTESGRVTGAECVRMELGEPDASGRRRPIPIKGSEFVLAADMIISAIGEAPDLSFLAGEQLETTGQGTIKVDPLSYQTSRAGVFSGGDCVTGPATLIEAIAAGNRAASSLDKYLTSAKITPSKEDAVARLTHEIGLSRQGGGGIVAQSQRQSPEQLPPADRVGSFAEVEKCLTVEAAAREAERCLRCYRVMLLSVAREGKS